MPDLFRCMFVTCSHRAYPKRQEFLWAAKNCRPVRKGHHAGEHAHDAVVERTMLRREHFAAYLRGATLVPVPPSGRGVDKPGDDLWSGQSLGHLLAAAYGADYAELLRRHTPVDKSSDGAERSLRRHVESIEADSAPQIFEAVLVDDLVASGSTICASAVALHRANPQLRVIKGLAVAYAPERSEDVHFDFAMREYVWRSLDERPRNYLVECPAARRIEPE